MTKLAKRIHRIQPSATLAMTAHAAKLKRLNKPVYNMSVGEPDLPTPINIQQAGKQAIQNHHTRYTPGSGTYELKQAILKKISRDNNLHQYTVENIIVSCGAKHALCNACQALFETGDEVIIFSPYWVSFPDFVSVTGATPVFVQTNSKKQFEPDFNDLNNKINTKTKGIIINSPSNPTGGVWCDKAIKETIKICEEYKLWIFSDECYEQFVYNMPYKSVATLVPDYNRILTFQSCSKTYAMTGWRIGYIAGNIKLVKAISKLQSQSTSCPNSIAQAAACEALGGDQSTIAIMRNKFKERRDFIIQELNSIEGIKCATPGGAFYAFPSFNELVKTNKIANVSDFCFQLLEEKSISEDQLRLSFQRIMNLKSIIGLV